jgi:membrane protein YqaA with SNARE-associated domain
MFANWLNIKDLKRKHNFYSKTGFYAFLAKNILIILTISAAIFLLFIIIENRIINLDKIFNSVFGNTNKYLVLTVFSISESFLGLIPPDFFIIWSKQFYNSWAIITILAVISYSGGIVSYKIGLLIRKNRKLNNYLTLKLSDNFKKIKKWGAVFIIVAALFPLPYSTICMISGILKYPFRRFIFLGVARIARFYIYALVLFEFFK